MVFGAIYSYGVKDHMTARTLFYHSVGWKSLGW